MNPSSAVIVTGAAGFIGARIAEACQAQGRPVIGVDVERFFGERPELGFLRLQETVDRDSFLDRLEKGQWRGRIEAIIHMGACSDTTELNEAFLERVNVQYSQRLWNYCAQERLPFFYASSAATYGDGSQGYSDDESAMEELRPLNPYGESKRRFDVWALAQEKSGLCPPAWAGFKFFNVYGFGERHKGRMASVVLHGFDQIGSEGEIRLFKSYKPGIQDGEQKRDFILVDDVVEVLMFALNGGLKRGIYNLGTGQARTFVDLARATFGALGKTSKIRFIEMPDGLRERYQYFTQARMERLRAAGYTKPFTPLEQGISRYIERLIKSRS